MATRRPIAVVFHRIGPYHHARLRAASGRQELVAIEGCSLDRVYRWDKVEHKKEYPLLTLFEAGDCEDQEVGALRSKVAAALGPVAPAVVMVPGWSSKLALACLEWCVAAATPAVVLSDSTAWDAERRAAKEWIKKKVVRLFSAGLVAGGPHVDYIVSLGLPRERVLEGYDVVDNDYFAHKAKEARRQEEEATPPGVPRLAAQFGEGRLPEKYFMASARFVEKKNLSRLIEAYARYRVLAQRPEFGSRETEDCNEEADCPVRGADDGQRAADPRAPAVTSPAAPWSLVLLGDGPLRETLESQLSSRSLQGHVLLPGFKQYDELPLYYGLAGAFIHASTTEQWGLVVNEAMASGLPVLVSDRCGCAADLVQEGVNGFTFDPHDVERLASLMLRLSNAANRGSRTLQPETDVRGERPQVSLEEMGKASSEIVSGWGLDRFAESVRRAVEIALSGPTPRASRLDRALLGLLLSRQATTE